MIREKLNWKIVVNMNVLSYRDNPTAPKELDSFLEAIVDNICGKAMVSFLVNGMLIWVWEE